MRFKKAGEDRHGPIVNVITDIGFCIGQISKWHGLFIATNWNGDKISLPSHKRMTAANLLQEHFDATDWDKHDSLRDQFWAVQEKLQEIEI